MGCSIITKEFLLSEQPPQEWFDCLKRLWNEAIFILNWHQHYRRVEKCDAFDLPPVEIKIKKVDKDWVYYCDRAKDFRIDRTKSWDKDNLEERPVINLVNPLWLTKPPIEKANSFDLKKPFAKKRCEWLRNSTLPADYINCFIELIVAPAWEAYLKGDRQKPRYKRDRDKVTTLVSASFRGQCNFKDDEYLQIPGMTLKVKGIQSRLINPINRMVADMRSRPQEYPRLLEKIDKLSGDKLNKLIKTDGKVKTDLSEDEINQYRLLIDNDEIFEKAMDYFSKPGAFKIINRENKTYLQITGEFPTQTITTPTKSVGVDCGLDLMFHTSSGLKVKHQNFDKDLARIDRLNQILSKKKYGSHNYLKLLNKINEIHGRVKRSRQGKQKFYAQQIADVHGAIAVKVIKPLEAIENPEPKKSQDGKYIPNGRSDASARNSELLNCALGQAVLYLSQQCSKKQRLFKKINLEPEATAQEILEVADFPSIFAASKLAPSLTMLNTGERIGGKGQPTTDNLKPSPIRLKKELVAEPISSIANPPLPVKNKRKKKSVQRAIG